MGDESMSVEAVAIIILVIFAIIVIGASITIIRTLLGILWLCWMIVTFPARAVWRLF
jgi:hypothetical protein